VDQDLAAYQLIVDSFSRGGDHAGAIGAEDHRHPDAGIESLGDPIVSAVEGGRLESDGHLARPGYGVRAFLQPQRSLELFKNECFHV